MRYSFNFNDGFVNGVFIFFEKGDESPARITRDAIARSHLSPTTIGWGCEPLTKEQFLGLADFSNSTVLDRGAIGIRFTVEKELPLLTDVLSALEKGEPGLAGFADMVRHTVLSGASLPC